MIKQLKLKNLTIPNNLFLAPLAGYTDAAMRRICSETGAGLTTTEMVSAKGLLYKSKNTGSLLIKAECEKPSSVQLFGSEPDVFYEVIKNNELLAPFDIIDINMGCPVRKIVSSGDGSALLTDFKRAASVVSAAAKATEKPITVKIRVPQSGAISELITALADNGASLVALHGRTAKMMYGGKADWEIIEEAAAKSSVPLIGNGDIQSADDAISSLNGNISGIMIGRGAIGNPLIFNDILKAFSQDSDSTVSDLAAQIDKHPRPYLPCVKDLALKHIEYMDEYYGERYTVVNMRKHLAYYVKGLKNMREFKSKINYANSVEELKSLCIEFL